MQAGLVPSLQLPQSAEPALIPAQSTLLFTDLPLPEMGLTFPPQQLLSRSAKRGRAVADVDGEHSCTQKKKRRLRLVLITSRLSPQFSYPATNIVDRGSSKIAVWARQKGLCQNTLRKAAILNRIRCDAVSTKKTERGCVSISQAKEQRHIEMAKLTLTYGNVNTLTRPVLSHAQSVPPLAAVRVGSHFVISGSPTGSPSSSPTTSRSPSPTSPSPPLIDSIEESYSECRSPNEAYAYSVPCSQLPKKYYTPPPPSPLGLSNYDAFDSEDEIPDPYSHLDDEDELSTYPYGSDGRYDSPFSPSVFTTESQHTTTTDDSQHLETFTHSDHDSINTAPKPTNTATSPNFPSSYGATPTSPNFAPFTPLTPGSLNVKSPIYTTSMSPENLPFSSRKWS